MFFQKRVRESLVERYLCITWQIHVTTLECAQIDIRIIANNIHTNSVASQTQLNIVFLDVKNILVSKFKLKNIVWTLVNYFFSLW